MHVYRQFSRLVLWSVLLSAATTPARAEVIERVVAVVNDDAVFLSELRRRAAPFLEAVLSQAPAGQQQQQLNVLYDRLLDQLVDETLIEQTAGEMQVSVSPLEVDQALSNVQRQNGMSEEQFWEAVKSQGFTQAQYRADVRKQLLRLKVINQKVRSRVNINPEEVRAAYEDVRRRTRRSERFHAAHLFIELPAEASATTVAAAMREAKRVRAGLSPDTFDQEANVTGGGDLGWLDQGDLPEQLENTLIDLEPGEISEPVRGPAGVHIFMLKDRKQQDEGSLPTFEDSKAGIEQELMAKAMQRQEAIFLDQLRRSAVIERRR